MDVDLDLLRKSLAAMDQIDEGMLDDQKLAYYKMVKGSEPPLDYIEFVKLFEQLDKLPGKVDHDNGAGFPECRAFFEFEGRKFIWRMLIGQGCAYQIFDANKKDWPEDWNMDYDESKKIVLG